MLQFLAAPFFVVNKCNNSSKYGNINALIYFIYMRDSITMSIRTHIPWLNFRGGGTKIIRDGCSSMFKSSWFSGLGTRNFRFMHISNSTSCGHRNVGHHGFDFRRSNSIPSWFGNIGRFVQGYATGFSLGNLLGGGALNWRSSANWNSYSSYNLYNSYMPYASSVKTITNNYWVDKNGNVSTTKPEGFDTQSTSDNAIYVDKTVKKIVKEKDPITGEDVYRTIITKTKVKSPDGSKNPIVEVDNQAGVYLDENDEIIYCKKTVIIKEKVFNSLTQKYEIRTTTKTYQVPSKDGKKTDLEPEIIDRTQGGRSGVVPAGSTDEISGSRLSDLSASEIDASTDVQSSSIQSSGADETAGSRTSGVPVSDIDDYTDVQHSTIPSSGTDENVGTRPFSSSFNDGDNVSGSAKPSVVRQEKRKGSVEDLINPSGLDNFDRGSIVVIKRKLTSIKNAVENQVEDVARFGVKYTVDYSALPLVADYAPGNGLDLSEALRKYYADLDKWFDNFSLDIHLAKEEQLDINFQTLKMRYKGMGYSDAMLRSFLDEHDYNLKETIEALDKLRADGTLQINA